MKIAIAMTLNDRVYHNNPCTAPKFAVYSIDKKEDAVVYSLNAIFYNPASTKKVTAFTDDEINCSCSTERQEDFSHACEHYALLDVIGGSKYLLADQYCKNTLRSLKNGGVAVYKIPSIVHDVELAIKNFLLGVYYASTVQHIHHAS
jgi:predicted Fe-Mo cluster-binding NifX family protein